VIQPASRYGLAASVVGLAALVVAGLLLWQGVRRITRPVQRLAAQTTRLAAGDEVEPLPASGIVEIDQLEQAFAQTARQIAAYRAGLRRYVGALTNAREEEQRRVARELHDETTQSLLAILRRIELYRAAEAGPAQQARLAELQALVANTLNGVRQISRDLRPLALEDLGLMPALRALAQAWSEADPAALPVQFTLAGHDVPLDPQQEMAVYRITQEALANVRKHARATRVEIHLSFDGERVCLDVQDNGTGFEPPPALAELAQRGHFGLMGMQERAWAAGGVLVLQTKPGHGTRLRATLPITATEAAMAP
jgi:two-component system sensor histidine kinase UhpB